MKEEFHYQHNRCLRMPGSPCFSSLECAMNEKIVDITQVVNSSTDDSLNGDDNLNRYGYRPSEQVGKATREVVQGLFARAFNIVKG